MQGGGHRLVSYIQVVLLLSLWNGKVKYNGKEINSALCYSNNDCGMTIDCDINGTRNIFMLLEKMIQYERQPEPFCHSKINGIRSNSKL